MSCKRLIVLVGVCGLLSGGALAQSIAVVDTQAGQFDDLALLPPGQVTRFLVGDDEEVIYVIQSPVLFSSPFIDGSDPRIIIGNNGGIAFAPFNNDQLAAQNQPLSSGAAFGGGESLMAFWDDIGNTTGEILVAERLVGGTGPFALIVQWNEKPFAGTADEATFQIQVFPDIVIPGSGPLDVLAQFFYKDIEDPRPAGGASATVGYQARTGENAEWSFETSGAVRNFDPQDVSTIVSIVRSNQRPVCDDGGPYEVTCSPVAPVVLQLDGTRSRSARPGMHPLDFFWETDCPNATFVDATVPMPTLVLRGECICRECSVTLTVLQSSGPEEGEGDVELEAQCFGRVRILDGTPPDITCPPPISISHGDHICDTALASWLASATASDSSGLPVTLVHNAPDCGLPPGTWTVTWTATDACGNTSECSSTVTVSPAERATPSQKGSLLIYPKVEVRYDDQGNVLADTYISILNDYPAP
ncbi:MAG: HYR domain-containing protein, partial [Phycisphaerae bacterium]